MKNLHFSDLEQHIGEQLGESPWQLIDQRMIKAFAALTADDQWIHLDAERAGTGPFGTTIAHGFLTLSLIPAFSRRVYRVSPGEITINYGLERVRFPNPVPAGARLKDTITLLDVKPVHTGKRALFEHRIERQNGEKPVCIAQTISLLTEGTRGELWTSG